VPAIRLRYVQVLSTRVHDDAKRVVPITGSHDIAGFFRMKPQPEDVIICSRCRWSPMKGRSPATSISSPKKVTFSLCFFARPSRRRAIPEHLRYRFARAGLVGAP